MSDQPDLKPASPARRTAAKAAQASFSLIWLVPIIALVVTLGIAWNAWQGRGQLVEVQFRDATGITPGDTAVKFREVTVGKVESVRFTPDLTNVIVGLRIEPAVSRYIDTDAEFWIVRPQVSAQGISRLDTVLSGAFIEGNWDANPGTPLDGRVVEGLPRAPLARMGAPGTWISLSSDSASGLTEGAPVTFRGIQIGRMENLRLSETDETVLVDVFVPAPHDKRLTSNTAFWDTSGFSLSLGAQGLSFNVNSLASLVQGGAQFATFSSGGSPIEAGHVFRLYPDEDAARINAASDESGLELRLTVLVDNAIRGLNIGADVQFQGLTVGKVSDLSVHIEPGQDGAAPEPMQDVTLAISPVRLGLPVDATEADALAFLQARANEGLRARVASAGFFGTSLMIELVDIPGAGAAEIRAAAPYPVMPSAASNTEDFSASAQGFISRIGKLPLEETLKSATDMMNSVTALASSEDTRAIPEGLRHTIDEARATMEQLRQATDDLRQAGAVDNAAQMLEQARTLAERLNTAAETLPQTMAQIDTAAAQVAQVRFAEIGDQAAGIMADLRAMLGSEDAAELPRNLSDVLQAASGLLTDLRDGNAAGSLNAALQSARTAADEIAAASRGLPDLTRRIDAAAQQAQATIAAYGARSNFNNETVNLMRELRRAASSFGQLAQMIERNPRAFIMGR
ncbi:MAG: MlaD family protein [Paracoccus sp. (in: a-proteobacteria)]|uniref:PqiB family protein n=1 Tax=Paracoccus sp. TaxID=267 RepID=UPI0026E06774|nr:MlaD family protein [Paracoccus sp. (in: a-proteobacteria)]MDO5620893.1 MlaD family protein [Paracoccus sp. (in: a-proteobacteria)]